MELFPNGTHVRLRSRWHNTYLYAAEDGFGVALSTHRASLNAAWKVHRLVRGGTSYVLLHGAAYGRYLGLIPEDARRARVVQRVVDAPEQYDVFWEAFEAEDGSGDVLMRHRTYGPWRNYDDPSKMMSWMVEAIPAREGPPKLPPVIPPPAPFRRRIQYVRANNHGDFNNLVWGTTWFNGRSVFQLRRELAAELDEAELGITLCVRAGSRGRRTPLVIDLPADEQTMEIIVLTTESEGAEALVHPDVDAQ